MAVEEGADVDHHNAWGDNAFKIAEKLENKNETMLMLEAARDAQKQKEKDIAAKKAVKVGEVATLPAELPDVSGPLPMAAAAPVQTPVSRPAVPVMDVALLDAATSNELSKLAPAAGEPTEPASAPSAPTEDSSGFNHRGEAAAICIATSFTKS